MNIIQERDTTTIRQTVIFNAPPQDVYEVIMDSKKHESLSGEKADISREVGGAFKAWGTIFLGSIWCFNQVVKLSRLGAPVTGGQITTQSLRSNCVKWKLGRNFASLRSAYRLTDSTVILADGWTRIGNQCTSSLRRALSAIKREQQVRRPGDGLIKAISEYPPQVRDPHARAACLLWQASDALQRSPLGGRAG